MKVSRFALSAVALVLAATACGGSSDAVSVSDVWGRPSPMDDANAAFYMQITGGSADDVLESASSAACGMVQIHETTMQDGVMSMSELPGGVPVPADAVVSLEPGGLHVMCMRVTEPLVAGEAVDLDLTFRDAGSVSVQAEIREDG
jgi:copper(I)-binding protein